VAPWLCLKYTIPPELSFHRLGTELGYCAYCIDIPYGYLDISAIQHPTQTNVKSEFMCGILSIYSAIIRVIMDREASTSIITYKATLLVHIVIDGLRGPAPHSHMRSTDRKRINGPTSEAYAEGSGRPRVEVEVELLKDSSHNCRRRGGRNICSWRSSEGRDGSYYGPTKRGSCREAMHGHIMV
jgi:hypothetical protein